MGTHIEAIRTHFGTQNIPSLPGNGDSQLVVQMRGEKREMIYATIIAEDHEDNIAVRLWGIAEVPEERRGAALEALNTLNKSMRWCKFLIDDDGDVIGAVDAVVTPETIGPVTLEVLMRCAHIIDEQGHLIDEALA